MNNVKLRMKSVCPEGSRGIKRWSAIKSSFGSRVSYLPYLNTSMFILFEQGDVYFYGTFSMQADADL